MNRNKTQGITLLVAFIAAVCLFFLGDLILGKYPVCIYYHWFAIPCPLCGLTRAVYEFTHLRISSAWTYNPLVYPLVLWYLLEVTHFIWKKNQQSKILLKKFRLLMLLLAILLLVFRCFKYFPLP